MEFTLEPIEGSTYYNSTFTNRTEVDTALKQVEAVANSIISEAKGSTYTKVKYIHDWIVDNVEYDNDNLENHDNIYGTFINRKVVCEGYAEAFKYLLDKLNIPCVSVYGDGYDNNGNVEAHAWNYVKTGRCESGMLLINMGCTPIYVGRSEFLLVVAESMNIF